MKPTEFIAAGRPPTLPQLIRDVVHLGGDRFSFVRPAVAATPSSPSSPPAICIGMITAKAVRELGPFMKEHLARLKQDPHQRVIVDDNVTVARVFEQMEADKQEWYWVQFNIMESQGLAVLIVGNSIDQDFADALTTRNCITNLT